MMTMDAKFAELKALHEKATQPPWRWEQMASHMWGLGQVPPGPSAEELTDPGGVMICGCSRCDACVKRGAKCFCPSDADQLLIAAMRNALPALLAAAEEAERMKNAIDHARLVLRTEINPSNYDHDDVMKLNAESIEALGILTAALSPAPAKADGGGA